MKALSILLVIAGAGSLASPAIFRDTSFPIETVAPLFGILFIGVGGAMLVADKICSKR
jgi:hypothetical protein